VVPVGRHPASTATNKIKYKNVPPPRSVCVPSRPIPSGDFYIRQDRYVFASVCFSACLYIKGFLHCFIFFVAICLLIFVYTALIVNGGQRRWAFAFSGSLPLYLFFELTCVI